MLANQRAAYLYADRGLVEPRYLKSWLDMCRRILEFSLFNKNLNELFLMHGMDE